MDDDITTREGHRLHEGTRLFLWVLASAGFFALLGAAFGGFTGAVNWQKGQAGGTGLGLRVLRAVVRLAERELTAGEQGAVVGAADGIVFGTLAGTLLGLFAGHQPGREARILGPAAVTGILLVGGALLFGGLAWGITRAGLPAIIGLFAGGVAGALIGLARAGTDGLFAGATLGALVGALVVVAVRMLVNRRTGPPRDP